MGKTILCVDHDIDRLQQRTELLEAAGYQVVPALDQASAMRALGARCVDCVLVSETSHYRQETVELKKSSLNTPMIVVAEAGTLPAELQYMVNACISPAEDSDKLLSCLQDFVFEEPLDLSFAVM